VFTLSWDKTQPSLQWTRSPLPVTAIKYFSFFIRVCCSLEVQFFSTFGTPHNKMQLRVFFKIKINKTLLSTTHTNTKKFGYKVECLTNPYDKIREHESRIWNLLFPYSTKRCLQYAAKNDILLSMLPNSVPGLENGPVCFRNSSRKLFLHTCMQ
jgi:hypothetical protein